MTNENLPASNFRLFLSVIRRQESLPRSLPVLAFLLVLYVAFNVSEPYFYKLFIDVVEAVLSGNIPASDSVPLFAKYALLWGGLTLASIFAALSYRHRIWSLGNLAWGASVRRVLHAFFLMPYDYHVSVDVGEKVRISERGPNAEFHIFEKFFVTVLPQSAVFLGFLSLGLYVDYRMMLVVLAFIPLLALVSVTVGKRTHKEQIIANDYWDRASGRLSDALQNVRVIRLFVRETPEENRINTLNRAAIDRQYRINFFWGVLESGREFLEFVVKIAVMLVGTYYVLHGKLSVGELFLFVALSGRFYGPLQAIESALREILSKLADCRKAEDLVSAQKEIDDGKAVFPGIRKKVSFENVSFRYPGNDRSVLENVTLEIPKGARVALVGHTGSGKSTIANLLLRFYDPSEGSVTVDGTDIRDFSLSTYRAKFAAVFQDTTLFNDTLRANLEYVRDGITMQEIEKACKEAEILDFIESLPDGFDTVVGERGLKLSGGEKQRVSIARAILSDPEILVLDEATSALDSRTESRIQKAFDALMKGRTSLVIAHRLSTVVSSDRIFVIDSGRIGSFGTHAELYEKSASYRELVDAQKNGFFCDEILTESP
ncbi:MAG: hypothetical protein QG650_637 [Patescibacteria group bacterium]|nr:hypothetical protein [Patescibacteria group bacterium]